MGNHGLNFEEFVSKQTKGAGADHMAHGLRLDDLDPSKDIGNGINAAIEAVLLTSSVPTYDRVTLRDLLRAKLTPYFRKSEDGAGASMLDVVTLGLENDADIKLFLARHDVDIESPEDFQYLSRIFEEAILFFDEHVAQEKYIVHPELRKLKNSKGIYEIFKTASGHGRKANVPQACAILRIAGVIDYMERDPLLALMPVAEMELADVIGRHFKKDKSKKWWFSSGGEEESVLLHNVERRTKDRMRIIAKLLHKPSNRTQEVLDHIGYRITTLHPLHTLKLIHMLFFHTKSRILPAVDIIPSESTNKLFDRDKLGRALANPDLARELVESAALPTINHAELTTAATPGESNGENPNSAANYKAIHITFNFPFTTKDGKRLSFPIEIQFLDRESSFSNKKGDASHHRYVEKQIAAVKARILGNNLLALFEARTSSRRRE